MTNLTWWWGELSGRLAKLDTVKGQVRDAFQNVQRELALHFRVLEPRHIEVGDWECSESPIGVCVYNSDEDPMHDDCLACHEPHERK